MRLRGHSGTLAQATRFTLGRHTLKSWGYDGRVTDAAREVGWVTANLAV